MNYKLSYICVCFCFLIRANSANLVHYWPFSNSLNDEVGEAPLEWGQNAYLTNDQYGNPNSAVRLSNGYLKAPAGVYFSNDFTVTAWVKLNTARYQSRILEFGNDDFYGDNFEFGFKDSTNCVFLNTWIGSGGAGFIVSDIKINLNEWTHVAAVLNESYARIYYNGVLVAFGPQHSPRNVLRKSNYIGKSNFEGDDYADATYDEMKIFDRSLSASEIMDEVNVKNIAVYNKTTRPVFPKSGLVNHWAFNGNTRDETGNADLYNGVNAYLTRDRHDKVNSALYLNNGYFEIKSNLTFGGDLTIAAWVRLRSTSYFARIIELGNQPRTDNIVLCTYMFTNYISFEVFNPTFSSIKSLSELKLNEWTHVAAVLKNSTAYLYLNGVLDKEGQVNSARNTTRDRNFIGKSNWKEDDLAHADYDDIKVFSRALSQQEIELEAEVERLKTTRPTTASKALPGLIHYWPFNSNTKDETGHADLFDSYRAQLIEDRFGKVNSALKLDDGYLTAPVGVYFSEQFTFTAWIKLSSVGFANILNFGNGLSNSLVINSDQTNHILVRSFAGISWSSLLSWSALRCDVWTHLTVVKDDNGESRLYINGDLAGVSFLNVPKNVMKKFNFFGKTQEANSRVCLDEIKIFNLALSQHEIKKEFNPNATDVWRKNRNARHHWSFTDNFHDTKGHADIESSKNATLDYDRFNVNNRAVHLSNGYLNVLPDVYFYDDFTFTIWIKLHSYQTNSRIIDFGNGLFHDNVIIGFQEQTGCVFVEIYAGRYSLGTLEAQKEVTLNKWSHVSVVLKNNLAKIFYDGVEVAAGSQYSPLNVIRKQNFIGKSNWEVDRNVDATFDEIKIFNVALNETEIKRELELDKVAQFPISIVLWSLLVTGVILVAIIGTILMVKRNRNMFLFRQFH